MSTEGISSAGASGPIEAQVRVLNGAGKQLEAVMATLLEGLEAAATAGSSGGNLLAIA